MTENATPQMVVVNPRRKLRRRVLDKVSTLQKFRHRLMDLSGEALRGYIPNGSWVTTYDVWDSHTEAPPGDLANNNAFVVIEVARLRGIETMGVCTEHRSRGTLISKPYSDSEEAPNRVYVGSHNTFNSMRAHPVLSIQPADKVYMPSEDDDSNVM